MEKINKELIKKGPNGDYFLSNSVTIIENKLFNKKNYLNIFDSEALVVVNRCQFDESKINFMNTANVDTIVFNECYFGAEFLTELNGDKAVWLKKIVFNNCIFESLTQCDDEDAKDFAVSIMLEQENKKEMEIEFNHCEGDGYVGVCGWHLKSLKLNQCRNLNFTIDGDAEDENGKLVIESFKCEGCLNCYIEFLYKVIFQGTPQILFSQLKGLDLSGVEGNVIEPVEIIMFKTEVEHQILDEKELKIKEPITSKCMF